MKSQHPRGNILKFLTWITSVILWTSIVWFFCWIFLGVSWEARAVFRNGFLFIIAFEVVYRLLEPFFNRNRS